MFLAPIGALGSQMYVCLSDLKLSTLSSISGSFKLSKAYKRMLKLIGEYTHLSKLSSKIKLIREHAHQVIKSELLNTSSCYTLYFVKLIVLKY